MNFSRIWVDVGMLTLNSTLSVAHVMHMSILFDSHLILFIYIATYCIHIKIPSVCISSIVFVPLANHICQKPSVLSGGFYSALTDAIAKQIF